MLPLFQFKWWRFSFLATLCYNLDRSLEAFLQTEAARTASSQDLILTVVADRSNVAWNTHCGLVPWVVLSDWNGTAATSASLVLTSYDLLRLQFWDGPGRRFCHALVLLLLAN